MTNPYHIKSPAVIAFSGGRTSGYMLWHILDYYDGKLPDDIYVSFANTGKEMPETLDFIQECSERWAVKVTWLEYDPDAEYQTKIVNHNSASRNGEPFSNLNIKKNWVPHPLMRYCTEFLKVKRFATYMDKTLGYETWTNVTGIRFDEPRRWNKQKQRKAKWNTVMPLVYADVTQRMVSDFWKAQPFDLQLKNINGTTPYGNCDLCFLKGAKTIQGIMRERPDLATWWINEEETKRGDKGCSTFYDPKKRPSYRKLLNIVQNQGDLFDDGVGSMDCMCTD